MSEKSSDFLTQYKAISDKLKKKFLRKPNATEPSDQFASLAAQCERSDLPQYAALSWLAVAKCESTSSNKNEEAVALLKAGRLFLEAERRNIIGCDEHLQTIVDCCTSLGDHSNDGDKAAQYFKSLYDLPVARKRRVTIERSLMLIASRMTSGLSCLRKVEDLWGDEDPLTGALALETGSALMSISPGKSIPFLAKACRLLQHSPPLHLHALGKLASASIALGDFHGAVSLFTEMVNTVHKITSTPFGVYTDILVRCEISRVLLILLLQPTPQKISPELAKFVEKYTWIGEPDPKTISWLGEELFFLLQSLVMSCQCQDMEAVHDLESDLWKYFSNEQRTMLHIIIKSLNNSDK